MTRMFLSTLHGEILKVIEVSDMVDTLGSYFTVTSTDAPGKTVIGGAGGNGGIIVN